MNQQLEILQISISNFSVLLLKYQNASGVISEREIEPLALFFEQNEWNLIAFCRLRKEKRQFLISRIHTLETTEKSFAPNQFSLDSYFSHKNE